MHLRILLTLLILTYSTAASGCSKLGKDTARCDSLLSFNGTARTIVVSNCSDLIAFDKSSDFGPWHAVVNVTFNCTVTTFPWRFADVFPNVRFINLPKCTLTSFAWQSVYAEPLRILDLSNCPMECTCANQWMRADGAFGKVRAPKTLRNCLPSCVQPRLKINETVITKKAGENVTIHVDIQGIPLNRSIAKPYFDRAFMKSPHNYTEIITPTSAELTISNLTYEDIGIISVRCWQCADYLSAKVELRVNLPLKVEFVEKTKGDTDFLVVQGHPIENITLTITRMDSNVSEIRILDSENDSIFFSSLIVRQETHMKSVFFQRTYRIFTKDIADGDHLSGDLRFKVCTEGSCDAVEKHVSHLGLIGVRKRISLAQGMTSRRASHETEETLLRLGRFPEERSSLASDYSNQLIPFIEIGDIKTHEKIGKGMFGQVYCGSWEKTGPRSVAVKVIEQADRMIEKEAATINRLDHPNIVKLYGVTRDHSNLLLVFELMNLGELRTYVRMRSPEIEQIGRRPPALTVEELKRIAYEIITAAVYLKSQQIVHRDIAARNCLVSGESDMGCKTPADRPPIRVKISDFGMSRRLYSSADYYTMEHKGMLPIRWLPPEACKIHKFTYMSDVWALGVTIWECFSYGGLPFGELTNTEVSSFALKRENMELIPEQPPHCPDHVYAFMKKCWIIDPQMRATAEELLADEMFDFIRTEQSSGAKRYPSTPNVPLPSVDSDRIEETSFVVASSSMDYIMPGETIRGARFVPTFNNRPRQPVIIEESSPISAKREFSVVDENVPAVISTEDIPILANA
ncbi:unnamed protein product [Caenorhabditis sp. 36 PRJEB53466]|nr:unnamed protein product [Caenorhabditis sp. 36 PRJEB53466]